MSERKPFDTGEALALCAPTGLRMSGRARKAAEQRLFVALFGDGSCLQPQLPAQPNERERMLAQAKQLRELAARGMCPKKYTKEALRLEQEASQ